MQNVDIKKQKNGRGSAKKSNKPLKPSSTVKRRKKAEDLDIRDYYPVKGQIFPIPMS